MNLRPRVLLLTTVLVMLSAGAAWLAARELAEGIIEQWAIRYADKQVLYDKSRTLQPILREIALSRQFANSQQIREWARHPDDPALTRRAIAEMETFRVNFADHSYFVALRQSGRYYHNNAGQDFKGRQFRYTLSPKNPSDRWFYDLIHQQRDMHINVNPDHNLGVTKLWIDVLLRDGNEILGVMGTGLDLTEFIREVVDNPQPGITSLFVDHGGAIQLYRDERLIDFASLTKSGEEHKTIDLLFDRQQDRLAIRAAMKELEGMQRPVISQLIVKDGKRYLAGIAWLPEIDWYEITLIDLGTLLPLSSFSSILLVYGLTLSIALLLFSLILSRLILRPLARMEEAVRQLRDGKVDPDLLADAPDNEIGRLFKHFQQMALTLAESRADLENKVRERTEALEHLSKADPLTDLLNRRGMTERLNGEISRALRTPYHFGVLLIDIDYFKQINDRFGHAAGDQALIAVAQLINATLRPYDSASRWGGDEFLVLIQDCDENLLLGLGERLRSALAEKQEELLADFPNLRISMSIGATFVQQASNLEQVLQEADHALYEAKEAGRNCLRLYSGQLPIRLI